MTRGLLYLGSDLERLYQVEDGQLHETSPDRRIDRLVVVADFVEESLVRVTLPRLRGRDLASLLQRRLEQEFRETPYRAACRLGPSRENPKQVDYIFVGLPIARRLDQRLRPLADAGVALGGLYSVSMLTARLLREAGDQAATRLVLLPTPAGVRFILVQHGQAVLSRLTTDIDLENEDAARVLAEELDRTVQYIYNARLVERGQAIDFSLWGDPPAVHALAGRTLTGLKPSPVPGLAPDSDPTRHGIAALLRLALRSPPDEQLAPPVLRRFHALALLRKWVLRTGVAAFVVLALVAGHFWLEGSNLRAESAQLQSRRATIEAETQALRDRLAALRVDPRTATEAIRIYRQYLEHLPAMTPTLVAVSRAFDAAPGYRLDALRWDVLDPPRIDPMTGQAATLPPGTCPSAPEPDAEGNPPAHARAGLQLTGRVEAGVSLRQAVEERRRFEAALAKVPGFDPAARTAAVDPGGAGVLRGGGEAAEATRDYEYCLQQETRP